MSSATTLFVLLATLGLTAGSSASTTRSSGRSTASSEVAAAKSFMAKYSKPATTIGVTTPLKYKAPAHKTLVYMKCILPQCTTEASGAIAAAKAIGWTTKVISYDSADPAQLVSGMTTALQYHPVAVINSGLPISAFQSVLPAYTKAKVPIVMLDVGPTKLPPIIIANTFGTQDTAAQGGAIAAWFIADSQAKGKALLVNVPGFPILNALGQQILKSVKSGCTQCQIQTLSLPISAVDGSGLTTAVTSALKRDPSLGYVLGVDAAFFDALPSALSAAGAKVKIASPWGDAVTEAALKTGTVGAVTAYAQAYQGWQAVDAILRHMEGMKLQNESNGTTPTQLLTKANVKTPTNDYQLPVNYPEQFKKLWHVG